MRRITLTRALTELKTINARVNNALAKGFFDYKVGTKSSMAENPDEVLVECKANVQRVEDLIKLRTELKRKIIKANQETQITIAGKTMSIAEAVDFKQIIESKKAFKQTLQKDFNKTRVDVNAHNAKVWEKIDSMCITALGSDKQKWKTEDMEAISKPYLKAQEATLIDFGGAKYIENLEQEIEQFEIDIDDVLSTINATTFIEVEE